MGVFYSKLNNFRYEQDGGPTDRGTEFKQSSIIEKINIISGVEIGDDFKIRLDVDEMWALLWYYVASFTDVSGQCISPIFKGK
jgi:hypothetical protein